LSKSTRQLNIVIVDQDASRRAQLTSSCRTAGIPLAQGVSSARLAADLLSSESSRTGLAIIVTDGADTDLLRQMQQIADAAPRTRLLLYSSLSADVAESLLALASEYGLVPIGVLPLPFNEDALLGIVGGASFEDSLIDDDALAPQLAEIQDAADRNLFEPWFQPQLEIRTGRIVGVEALLRWRLQDGSTRLPRSFLSQLEAAGLASDITLRTMICAAECISLVVGREKDFSVSINVSPGLLETPGFVAEFHAAVLKGNARTNQIVIEIDERDLREPSRTLLENLTRLRILEFGVCIDNYLAGGSSIARVAQGPFTQWKISSAYTAGMPVGSRAWSLVESSILLAHKLGVRTIAGGVETPSQMEKLLHLHCDAVQGFMIAPPMPILEFMQWMEARTRQSATDLSKFILTGHFESTVIDRTGVTQ